MTNCSSGQDTINHAQTRRKKMARLWVEVRRGLNSTLIASDSGYVEKETGKFGKRNAIT